MTSIYDFSAKDIDGKEQSLSAYKGKALLVVNTASKCGFTPQYAGLEALQKKLAPRGFDVLGFPCDQFGNQEPGDEAEIRNFCSLNYDVSFPMFAKIDVNGSDATSPPRTLERFATSEIATTSRAVSRTLMAAYTTARQPDTTGLSVS